MLTIGILMGSPSVLVCFRCTAVIRTNSYKIQCNKCKVWCHRDCANLTIEDIQSYGRERNAENGRKWYCLACEKDVKPDEANSVCTPTTQISAEKIESIIQENSFLKRLINELEEKNALLNQNKNLLEEKVVDLQHRLEVIKNDPSDGVRISSQKQNIQNPVSTIGSQMPQVNTPTINRNLPTSSYSQALLKPRLRVSDTGGNEKVSTPQSMRKQKSKRRLKIGTAETENLEIDFTGKEENKDKKAWLFISRVRDHVTEGKIKEYIKNKADINHDEDIMVKKIKTKYDTIRKDCQCFQIGVRFDVKDKLYEETFWPQRVAFRRFDFDVTRRQEENQTQIF